MAPTYQPIEYYRRKFYQNEQNSKNFANLSAEQLAVVAGKIYKKQEQNPETTNHFQQRITNLDRYEKTLQYLTNPFIHLEFKTFDERIAYLIMATDPYLVIFKEYLKTNIPSMNEINNTEDSHERANLIMKRNMAISEYERNVRDKVGFYDPKLVKYEELYFKRYFGNKELITDSKMNSNDALSFMARCLPRFKSISDERYEELKEIAQYWLSCASDYKDIYNAAAYSILNQKKLLGLKNVEEQLALFVLIVDSELDMLRIFEEESKMSEVEQRIKEQFGSYNKDLLSLERKFHCRFCPEKELSVWTKLK